jgi:hypothetical protein
MTENDQSMWHSVEDIPTAATDKLKVDGGYLYHVTRRIDDNLSSSMAFVPDIDLTRYEAHLRDAYKKGYEDGLNERKCNQEEICPARTDIP